MNPTLRLPLERVPVAGAVTVRAFLEAELRLAKSSFGEVDRYTKPVRFRVDTAADVTVMSTAEARGRGLTVPEGVVAQRVMTAAGAVVKFIRVGTLVARIPGFEGELFFWPCHFHEDLPATFLPLLGMAGVVNGAKRLKLTIDADPAGGELLVELKRGPAPAAA